MYCNLSQFIFLYVSLGSVLVSGWDDGKIRAFYPETGRIKFVVPDAHTEKVSEWVTERVTEGVSVCECSCFMCVWVSDWEREWVSEWVSEGVYNDLALLSSHLTDLFVSITSHVESELHDLCYGSRNLSSLACLLLMLISSTSLLTRSINCLLIHLIEYSLAYLLIYWTTRLFTYFIT